MENECAFIRSNRVDAPSLPLDRQRHIQPIDFWNISAWISLIAGGLTATGGCLPAISRDRSWRLLEQVASSISLRICLLARHVTTSRSAGTAVLNGAAVHQVASSIDAAARSNARKWVESAIPAFDNDAANDPGVGSNRGPAQTIIALDRTQDSAG
jgi:hypothetical protein